MASLVGKVALVTGGAQGIGKAICRRFLEEKIKVCLADIDVEKGEATLKEFQEEFGAQNVIFEKLDVSDENQFENVVKIAKEHFGGHLDILINNAGIANEIEWKKLMQINLFGVAIGIHLANRYLSNSKGEKGGTVINVASIAAINLRPYLPHYSASKCGVVALTLTWGHESNVRRTNIKVNAICPHAADTNISIIPIDDGGVGNAVLEKRKLVEEKLQPIKVADGVIKILREDVNQAVLVVSPLKGMYYHPCSIDDVFFESNKK